jgi:LysR family hydrogen peroxide-inducible transcriptional activator
MTLVQLEYIAAVDTHRHFAAAAKACFVTQPTLSMQIQKLEEELGVKIFDRSKQPVLPTENGQSIIEQARRVLAEKNHLTEMIESKKGIVNGELKIGIIPTLAPYLLPLFIQSFTQKNPHIKLQVHELTTDLILAKLKDGRIDVGILVTPLHENGISEMPLFYEEMVTYVSKKNIAYKKTYVLPKDIDPSKLWLLEEGHCFRSQIMNLCELRAISNEHNHFAYEASNLETLKKMVDLYDGITVLPELATTDLNNKQLQQIRYFKHPAPVREVSLAIHRNFVKRRLIEVLKHEIMNCIPQKVKKNKKAMVVAIE